MKSITEILGGAQILLEISYDLQDSFEEYLTEEHRGFLILLRIIEEAQPPITLRYRGTGRRPYQNGPFMRSFFAMRFFRIPTVENLIKRLISDPNLRAICGFTNIPSAATFSRRFKEFAETSILSETLDGLIDEYYQDRLVLHISRDSTAIPTRERPVNKKEDTIPKDMIKRKRGRPLKTEPKHEKKASVLETQLDQDVDNSLSELQKCCAWGCKKNSQGKVSSWKGYKLHLDVSDIGFPVTAVITGANVHDSQAAIPMEKLTEQKIQHCYSLMDAAYDADAIAGYIRSKDRIPIIDKNKRRNDDRPPMDKAKQERFKIRTVVERAFSQLKDWLIPTQIFVRGYQKVSFVLMSAVVCLAATKILQYFVYPKYT